MSNEKSGEKKFRLRIRNNGAAIVIRTNEFKGFENWDFFIKIMQMISTFILFVSEFSSLFISSQAWGFAKKEKILNSPPFVMSNEITH